jgi:hypothetical protein
MKIVLKIALAYMFTCTTVFATDSIKLYNIHEITLKSQRQYKNPYKDVDCWIELNGPDFKKKIYGFWDGSDEFMFRVVATKPGKWSWSSFSNQKDEGLNGKSGDFIAKEWTEREKEENPNRRGFIQATSNRRALEYADGTPYFFIGDTWWAASTWRFPLKGKQPDPDYLPAEGFGFEEALQFRKKQGYNGIGMIAAYPNWKADEYPHQFLDENGVAARDAWEKNLTKTAKDMHDEKGNMPFEVWDKSPVIANYDRINPEYFKSLDAKMQYCVDQGFVVFLETVRRDHLPSWKAYFDWPASFNWFNRYMVARYGAYNIIFSPIHLDYLGRYRYTLGGPEVNEALTLYHQEYGPLPYGQLVTPLMGISTYRQFGGTPAAPWLTMHSQGCGERNHQMYFLIEEMFNLPEHTPMINLEPYYPGWPGRNEVNTSVPVEPDSEKDHYYARAQMYGNVLSGNLGGHMYGSGAYCGNTTGEPKGEKNGHNRPYIWEHLNYPSGAQMQHLARLILSEGDAYQKCIPSPNQLKPNKAKGAPEGGLDGWSYLLIAPEKTIIFSYFEETAEIAKIYQLIPNTSYQVMWYNPSTGNWLDDQKTLKSDKAGTLDLGTFPDSTKVTKSDWALKLKAIIR